MAPDGLFWSALAASEAREGAAVGAP